jgi:hypothetical protein
MTQFILCSPLSTHDTNLLAVKRTFRLAVKMIATDTNKISNMLATSQIPILPCPRTNSFTQSTFSTAQLADRYHKPSAYSTRHTVYHLRAGIHALTKSVSAPAAISVVLIFHVIFMSRQYTGPTGQSYQDGHRRVGVTPATPSINTPDWCAEQVRTHPDNFVLSAPCTAWP